MAHTTQCVPIRPLAPLVHVSSERYRPHLLVQGRDVCLRGLDQTRPAEIAERGHGAERWHSTDLIICAMRCQLQRVVMTVNKQADRLLTAHDDEASHHENKCVWRCGVPFFCYGCDLFRLPAFPGRPERIKPLSYL